jgi:hypothetical protein
VNLKASIKEQYHAGLVMLADCVERCPPGLWLTGEHPRTVWRIAFHAAFFTQLYLGQEEASFQPWPARTDKIHPGLWTDPADVEPFELEKDAASYDLNEMLAYIRYVDGLVDTLIDELNLDATETGFSWYQNMDKFSHILLNLRHLQGHVGQLSEILMAHGIDIAWVGSSNGLSS